MSYTGQNQTPADINDFMDNPNNDNTRNYPTSTTDFSHYMAKDTSVLYNGQPTVRMDPTTSPRGREIDVTWINLVGGNHVVFIAKVLSGHSTHNYPYSGVRLGLDMYASPIGRVESVPRDYTWLNGEYRSSNSSPFTHDTLQKYADYVGNAVYPSISPTNPNPIVSTFQAEWDSNWVILTWDFYVPKNTYYNASGASATINGGIPWFDCASVSDTPASAWFADIKIYVDPSGSPSSQLPLNISVKTI